MSKTVLITGASRGIGEKTARIFASNGYNTVINYLNSENKAKKLVNELRILNPSVIALKADVSNFSQVKNLIRKTNIKFGKIDILVNNAGICLYKQIQDTTEQNYEKIMAINFKGIFNTTKAVVPDMISRKNGTIINVSSIWGEIGASCESLYAASKAAVIGFSKSLQKELEPSGIKVYYISPCFVKTDMTKKFSSENFKMPEEIASKIFKLSL